MTKPWFSRAAGFRLPVPPLEMLYHPNKEKNMSYRNGDKSREHRLRKAREKKRGVIREIKAQTEAKAEPSAKKK